MELIVPQFNSAEIPDKETGQILTLFPTLAQAKSAKNAAVLCTSTTDLQKAKRAKVFSIITESSQSLLEQAPDAMMNTEWLFIKDGVHQRYSGLNHVLLNIMKKNNTVLLISLSKLIHAPQEQRIKAMGRITQNLNLAKKFGVKAHIVSEAKTIYGLRTERARTELKEFLLNCR